jgi:biopolymer transport protein ExbD
MKTMKKLKKYPFNEGEDYYIIENNSVIWSCWDDQSEEIHTDAKVYYNTVINAIESLKKNGAKEVNIFDCGNENPYGIKLNIQDALKHYKSN